MAPNRSKRPSNLMAAVHDCMPYSESGSADKTYPCRYAESMPVPVCALLLLLALGIACLRFILLLRKKSRAQRHPEVLRGAR